MDWPAGYFRLLFVKMLAVLDLHCLKEVFVTHGAASSGRVKGTHWLHTGYSTGYYLQYLVQYRVSFHWSSLNQSNRKYLVRGGH